MRGGDCSEVHRLDGVKKSSIMENADDISCNESSETVACNGKPVDHAATLFDCTNSFVDLDYK